MAAAHSSAHSPHQSRAIRMVTQHHFHHTGPISQEGSPSPSAQRKSRTARRARSLEFEGTLFECIVLFGGQKSQQWLEV